MPLTYTNKPLRVANSCLFAKKGTIIPSTGLAVDENNIPSGESIDLACWNNLGNAMKVTPKKNPTYAEAYKVNSAGLVVLAGKETVKIERTYSVDIKSMTKIAFEIIFGTSLDDDTGEGEIDSVLDLEGWFLWMGKRGGSNRIVANVWGVAAQESDPDIDPEKFIEMTFSIFQLPSPLNNKIQFLP